MAVGAENNVLLVKVQEKKSNMFIDLATGMQTGLGVHIKWTWGI